MFFDFWNLASRSFNYVGTMAGIYPTSLNWQDIETVARLNHVHLTRDLLRKLRVAEELTMIESTKKK